MAQQAWGSATENKGGGSADPNVLKLTDQNRIRLLDAEGPRKWRQHSIDGANFEGVDDNAYRSATCPRGAEGIGNAPCPLCMKPTIKKEDGSTEQQFPISIRYAANVWDYESGEVKVLIGGKQIFQEFDAVAKVGFDPTDCDFIIFKMGKDRQTSYKVVRGSQDPLPKPITPEMLHDLDKYETPMDVGRIFEILAEVGIDYDALELPVFTLQEALAFQMPYTKHKGMTLEQLAANDLEFMQWLYGTKREQGQYGDAVFQAMHTVLMDMGEADPLEDMPKAPPRAQVQQPATSPPATQTNGTGTVKLVPPGGGEPQEFPAATEAGLLAAGFTKYQEPTPEAAPTESYPLTMVGADGSEVSVENEAVKSALMAAGYTVKDEALATPTEPADTDEVVIDIGGTRASMAYGQAKGLIQAGTATLVASTDATSPPKAEPLASLPADDAMVMVKLDAMPTPIEIPFKDAKSIVANEQGHYEDEALAALVLAHKADEHAEQIRTDAQQGGVETPDPRAQAGTDALSKHLTEGPNANGKFTHPAIPDKEYATKGAVTQALNRLTAQSPGATEGTAPAAASPGATGAAPAAGAPATGKDALLEQAKDLLASTPEYMNDFDKLMQLFNEVAGKRNISEFDESELQALIAKLQTQPAAA